MKANDRSAIDYLNDIREASEKAARIALLKLIAKGEEDIRAERYSGQDEVLASIKARLVQKAESAKCLQK